MTAAITIEIPEDIRILLEKNPVLKKKFEKIAIEAFREKLLKFMVSEELTRKIDVSEELIMKFDEEIKEGIVKRLEEHGK